MIYTVECAFTDPARENAWNAWYDGEKLESLLSVPGFRAAQRFRAVTETPAPYLAIHSIRDAAVLDQKVYRDAGGATFGGWNRLVTHRDRNLYAGIEAAPEVGAEQMLVLIDDPATEQAAPDMDIAWLEVAGSDRTVARRGLAIVDMETGADLARSRTAPLKVYEPITNRRISPFGIGN